MDGLNLSKRISLILMALLFVVSCATTSSQDDSASLDEGDQLEDSSSFESTDELSLDDSVDSPAESPADQATENLDADLDTEDQIEKEVNQAESIEPAPQQNAEPDEFAEFDDQKPAAEKDEFAEFDEQKSGSEPVSPQSSGEQQDEFAEFENQENENQKIPPPAVVETQPIPEPVVVPQNSPSVAEVVTPVAPEPVLPGIAQITDLKYRSHEEGGTLIVTGSAPLTYKVRRNDKNQQLIVDIENVQLPKRLQRPLVLKDFPGMFGAVDPYQNPGSTTARIVIQLRDASLEPVIQPESNSLLVIGDLEPTKVAAMKKSEEEDVVQIGEKGQPLSAPSLEHYMAGSNQFYGKRISIEVTDLDIREVLKLISEETGINMIVADDVKGNITLKLRQVPWDQALILIMKSRKLGYTRTGNVLRIAPLAEIRQEEDEAQRLAKQKQDLQPLVVKLIPISYASVTDMQKQIQPFLTPQRGTLSGDERTSSLIISDLPENIARIEKLIRSIDVPPPQVLIEGKVVEATDKIARNIGINWSGSGTTQRLGNRSQGRPIRSLTSMDVTPGSIGTSALSMRFSVGTLDILGDLSATLSLFEREGSAKVVSSPRVMTLHNEKAQINQTTQIPLITSNAVAGGASTESVTFQPVKLSLGVTPQVTNDGSVIMNLEVNRDFAEEIVSQRTQARPISSRAATTKVLVKNGQTAVIGGIYQSDMTVGETKVPILGDIPILGWFFKSQSKDQNKNELLIFVTPRIVGNPTSEVNPALQAEGIGQDSGNM